MEVAVVGAAAAAEGRDRFGLGWRAELAAGILSHLDRIDLIEVIADDYFDAARGDLRALKTLAAQISIVLHGVPSGSPRQFQSSQGGSTTSHGWST